MEYHNYQKLFPSLFNERLNELLDGSLRLTVENSNKENLVARRMSCLSPINTNYNKICHSYILVKNFLFILFLIVAAPPPSNGAPPSGVASSSSSGVAPSASSPGATSLRCFDEQANDDH